MPLPFIIAAAAVAAGTTGIGSGIHGAVKMKRANHTLKSANLRHKENLMCFEVQSTKTSQDMDALGNLELEILNSFELFSELFERIKNRPEFKPYNKEGIQIPEYDSEQLKKVSVGAGILIGSIGGAAAGTAGGFAAAGATTAAVMALGTSSTGTAIASLSGAAATNATLAALGGGAIAAGGGGIALGTTILGAATFGIGLLVGGVIFNVTGSSLSDKAEEAWEQMEQVEKAIRQSCCYMQELSAVAVKYRETLAAVKAIYLRHLTQLQKIIIECHKVDWRDFSQLEKQITENTSLLVGLLYNMCKVQMVLKTEEEHKLNKINYATIHKSVDDAERLIQELGE